MQKLFIDSVFGNCITLSEAQGRHLTKSLRMRAGDMVTVCNGSGTDYGCRIENTIPPVTLQVCYQQASNSEPSLFVTLFQGLPKGDKMDDIIQKGVELGVSRIYPVLTARSVSRPDDKSAEKKRQRWQKIALEAAQQSGRGIVPQICPLCTFDAAVRLSDAKKKILFYEGGGAPLHTLLSAADTACDILIGPEGGFNEKEVANAKAHGAACATLGPRILRTQTAPAAALTAAMLLSGNLE